MNTEELELTKKAVQLLNDRNLKELKELLAEQNPADISNIFEEVPRTDVILLFRLLLTLIVTNRNLSSKVFQIKKLKQLWKTFSLTML